MVFMLRNLGIVTMRSHTHAHIYMLTSFSDSLFDLFDSYLTISNESLGVGCSLIMSLLDHVFVNKLFYLSFYYHGT